jgi:hypothetical protein
MTDLKACSQIEMFVSAKKLPNKDAFSKSDPFCVMELQEVKSGEFREVGRSEYMLDNLNPEFRKEFLVDYFFEEHQLIRVTFYDRDSKSEDLKKHDYMGHVDYAIGDLVAAPGQTLHLQLLNKKGKVAKKDCLVTIRGEETSASKDLIKLTMRAEKLDKKDFFGKSDPYLEFYRLREDNSWIMTHKTEVVMNNLNPTWKEIVLPMQVFCNGDKHRPLKIKCWDWDSDGSNDLIGECEASVADMMGTPQFRMDVKNPELEKKKKNYRSSGSLVVQAVEIVQVPSFLDYIKGGCSINLMVAVDFTGSNGDPNSPGTLHYRFGGANQYQQAIRTIGNILAPYDSDNMIPVWGFGGRVFGEVSHCFALTFDEAKPEVRGVEGIMKVYDDAFKNVTLSGPTLFSQIMQTATSICDEPYSQDSQHYGILLILTDGVINDMPGTIAALKQAAKTPLSVIIIGVGDADFADMEKLDGDDEKDSKNVSILCNLHFFLNCFDLVERYRAIRAFQRLCRKPHFNVSKGNSS